MKLKRCLFAVLIPMALIRAQSPIPVAILPFEERGAGLRGEGRKVTDLLFAELITHPGIYLVDREDLGKQLAEQSLGVTGLAKGDSAAKVGQLTGARLLISGSLIESGPDLYLVARVTSSETGRMAGAKVRGSLQEELGPLVDRLAVELGKVLEKQGADLLPAVEDKQDTVALLTPLVEGRDLPVVYVSVEEEHIGQRVIDPAVETELSRILLALGFTVLDAREGNPEEADVRILGKGFSEFAARKGDLVSVKARVELRILDAEGKVVAYDRQTTLSIGAAEHIAGKTALQQSADLLARRMLPLLLDKGSE